MLRQDIKGWVVGFFFLVFFGFVVNRLLFFSSSRAEQVYGVIVYPFLAVHRACTAPLRWYAYVSQSTYDLEQHIQKLCQERDHVQAELVSLYGQYNFIEEVKDIASYAERYKGSYKRLAKVLLRSLGHVDQFYLIDKGSVHGVKQNMVAVYTNNLVGIVSEVYPWYSKIRLITDTKTKIAARAVKSKATGIYQGLGNDKPVLKFVAHYQNLQADDMIVSTGKGLLYPQGFGLGRIRYVQSGVIDQHVYIQPLINVQQLDYVFVISQDEI